MRTTDEGKQKREQKLNASKRIEMLLDKGSFREIGAEILGYKCVSGGVDRPTPYDGVITGFGRIAGRDVIVFAQDFSVRGGTIGCNHGKKIARIIQMAIQTGRPVVGIYDSCGARIDEGVNALAGCGDLMRMNVLASGRIPQISVVVGNCAGAAAYSPALCDFIFMVDDLSCMFVTGKDVVKSVTGEECTTQELGGSDIHNKVSGVSHFRHKDEKECLLAVRRLLELLPSHYGEAVKPMQAYFPNRNAKFDVIPANPRRTYDVRLIIGSIADNNSYLSVMSDYACSIETGFARLCGRTVGFVANQPLCRSGCLDCDSSDKAARFIRFCDCYDIPIITLVDTPGFLPGVSQEHSGIIRHGAKLLYAYAEATTSKITIILRKAYGGAYIAMCSRHIADGIVYALPDAEIGVMGAQSAVAILHKKALSTMTEDTRAAFVKEKIDECQRILNCRFAAQEGYVDAIIQPEEIRERIYMHLHMLAAGGEKAALQKKHGNIPL